MIEKIDDTFELECDHCSENLITSSDRFIEAISEAKDEGWLVIHRDGDFYHFCCRECADECLNPKQRRLS